MELAGGMIMHVITNYAANAGAETMLSRLLRATDDRGFVVSLIDVSDRNRLLAGDGVQVEQLGIRSPGRAVTAVVDLAQLIARENPRAILCWMYHAMVAGTLAQRLSRKSVPVFWNVRQSAEDLAALSASTRVALAISRRLSHLPAGIIYNSSRSLDLHRRLGFCHRNVEVIPNGFDAVADPPPISRTRQVLGIAARFHPQKDYETFFQAAALLSARRPDVRFTAVGAGLHQDNAVVREMLVASGLPAASIKLQGEMDDMDAFYRSIDVLVLSSRTEGFPNVVAEAMSYGKPVVTTDVGDAAAIVGETGVVVRPGDAQALAAGMSRMLDLTSADYAALSRAARQRIGEHFSLTQVAGRYHRFLECSQAAAQGAPTSRVFG
ncbi:glycosyltransferase [Mesorhizobium sp. M00.F.Ca.ET.216.01.1.1]|uniref:glycosyltransferase n=1 Tax=Mesorhizobium sp. M00.F.Ca.ET.216.01.1.1 TaxID=2500528 RepID=UPI001FDEF236|nr:glycosyltransferase [Mesorhizobium sp. M00.F.Ca.ET.216.01.1.1]